MTPRKHKHKTTWPGRNVLQWLKPECHKARTVNCSATADDIHTSEGVANADRMPILSITGIPPMLDHLKDVLKSKTCR